MLHYKVWFFIAGWVWSILFVNTEGTATQLLILWLFRVQIYINYFWCYKFQVRLLRPNNFQGFELEYLNFYLEIWKPPDSLKHCTGFFLLNKIPGYKSGLEYRKNDVPFFETVLSTQDFKKLLNFVTFVRICAMKDLNILAHFLKLT